MSYEHELYAFLKLGWKFEKLHLP